MHKLSRERDFVTGDYQGNYILEVASIINNIMKMREHLSRTWN
jgi:hypothetical protein